MDLPTVTQNFVHRFFGGGAGFVFLSRINAEPCILSLATSDETAGVEERLSRPMLDLNVIRGDYGNKLAICKPWWVLRAVCALVRLSASYNMRGLSGFLKDLMIQQKFVDCGCRRLRLENEAHAQK
ncbi:hypothetical protein Tco_0576977 [Tanacetum coccineum]